MSERRQRSAHRGVLPPCVDTSFGLPVWKKGGYWTYLLVVQQQRLVARVELGALVDGVVLVDAACAHELHGAVQLLR